MRMSAVFRSTLFLSWLLFAPIAASNEIAEPRVSIKIDRGSIQELLNALVSQTGLTFVASPEVIDVQVSITVADVPVSQLFALLRDDYLVCVSGPLVGDLIKVDVCRHWAPPGTPAVRAT